MRSFRSKPIGWRNDNHRHYLAAKYGSAGRRYYYTPTYVAGDLPLIGADAVGTAGAAVVPWIPIAVPVALAYVGVKAVKKRHDAQKKKGKGFFAERGIDLIDIRKYEFGSVAWQDAMAHNIREKIMHHEELGPAEKAFVATQKEHMGFYAKKADVVRDPETGLKFEWKGGHTVNVFDESGANFNAYSIGDFSKDNATTKEEFEDSVRKHLKHRTYDEFMRGDEDVKQRYEESLRKRALRQTQGRGDR